MSNRRSGALGKVTIESEDVAVKGWSISVEADTDDTTDSSTGGWADRISSIKSASGSFTAVWDILKNPFEHGPAFAVGDEVALELYIGTPGDAHMFELQAILKTVEFDSENRLAVKWNCTFESTGVVTMPTTA